MMKKMELMSQYDFCIRCKHHIDMCYHKNLIIHKDMARHFCGLRKEYTTTQDLYERPVYCEYGK